MNTLPHRYPQLHRTAGIRAAALAICAALFLAACTSNDAPEDADEGSDAASTEEETATEEAGGFRFEGPGEDALLGAAELEELSLTVTGDEEDLAALVLVLGERDVTADAEVADGTLTYAPTDLEDGDHTVHVAEAPEGWTGGAGEEQDAADTGDGDDAAETGDAEEGADADTDSEDADSEDATDGTDSEDATDGTEDADADDDAHDDGTADDEADTVDDGTAADTVDLDELDTLHTWRFEVKAEPPALALTSPATMIGDEPLTVAGTTDPDAEVSVNDTTVTADGDGAFEVALDGEIDELTIVAVDRAGNTAEHVQAVGRVPSRVTLDEYRGVHATFWAWASPELREPMLEMLDEGRINAIQLDLKDEGGHIGYDSEVELANEIGADIGPLDLEQAVADLHAEGVPVIGRIVAFADPALAEWAWENDRRDMVIQLADGSDYFRGSYAGFSNYTHEDVIAYNLDLAVEAARAGVDHILWDYIRRPEGQSQYTVPGLETTPEEAIVEFTRLADERLAPYGVTHGASVYGIAADRPEQIGQDIPEMAKHLDYVAPMIYPSHWGPGEYGVSEPNRQPYDIIRATLEVWDEAIEGTDARVIPWLEDTAYRAWDRPFQIAEQIRATNDHDVNEWLMWNPGSSYTPEAYERFDG